MRSSWQNLFIRSAAQRSAVCAPCVRSYGCSRRGLSREYFGVFSAAYHVASVFRTGMGPAGSGHGGSRNPKKGRFAPGSDVAVAPPKRCARHARNVNLTNVWNFSATRVPVLNRGRISRLHRARQSTRASTHRGEPYRAPGFSRLLHALAAFAGGFAVDQKQFWQPETVSEFSASVFAPRGHGWLASPPRPAALMARPPGSVR